MRSRWVCVFINKDKFNPTPRVFVYVITPVLIIFRGSIPTQTLYTPSGVLSEMTDCEVPDAGIMNRWTHEVGQIELVDNEVQRFCQQHLTDFGHLTRKLASAPHPPSSRMLQLFDGVHSRNFSEEKVWMMLRKLKMARDESVLRLNTWMNDNASERGAVSSSSRLEAESIESMVETWSRDVIGRYERIAQGYMTELDSPTPTNSTTSGAIFIDTTKMSRGFHIHFPVLVEWNLKESVVYRASRGKIASATDVSPQPAMDTRTDDVAMTETTVEKDDDDGADERAAKRARTDV